MACGCLTYTGLFFHGRMGLETVEMREHIARCPDAWDGLVRLGIRDSTLISDVTTATIEGKEMALDKLRNGGWVPPPFSTSRPPLEAPRATPAAASVTNQPTEVVDL